MSNKAPETRVDTEEGGIQHAPNRIGNHALSEESAMPLCEQQSHQISRIRSLLAVDFISK